MEWMPPPDGIGMCQSDVYLVRFYPGPGDGFDQARVCHNDALHMGTHKPFNGCAIARCFDHNFIVLPQGLGKFEEAISDEFDATFIYNAHQGSPLAQTIDEYPFQPHPCSTSFRLWEPVGKHDIYGFALAAQPGKS